MSPNSSESKPWVDRVLHTTICDKLGVEFPIVQAGMGYLARQELAAAVSEAGGLGVIGSSGNLSPDQLRDEIQEVKDRTSKPFAVNLLFPRYDESTKEGMERARELQAKVGVVLEEKVPVLGSGLGVPSDAVFEACSQAGTVTMCTIGAVRHAVKAQDAGAQVLVAQGWEAGGHNSGVATMALVPQVAQVAEVPVLAAGGIASGAGLIAALALGASGVYMGTVFAASAEARAHDNYKKAVVEAIDTSTTVTRAYSGKPGRMIRNEFTQYYEQHPEEIEPFPLQMAKNESRATQVRVDGELHRGPIPAGQIAGYLRGSESAADVVRRIIAEARETLEQGLPNR